MTSTASSETSNESPCLHKSHSFSVTNFLYCLVCVYSLFFCLLLVRIRCHLKFHIKSFPFPHSLKSAKWVFLELLKSLTQKKSEGKTYLIIFPLLRRLFLSTEEELLLFTENSSQWLFFDFLFTRPRPEKVAKSNLCFLIFCLFVARWRHS